MAANVRDTISPWRVLLRTSQFCPEARLSLGEATAREHASIALQPLSALGPTTIASRDSSAFEKRRTDPMRRLHRGAFTFSPAALIVRRVYRNRVCFIWRHNCNCET